MDTAFSSVSATRFRALLSAAEGVILRRRTESRRRRRSVLEMISEMKAAVWWRISDGVAAAMMVAPG